jgi:hypothetical protein
MPIEPLIDIKVRHFIYNCFKIHDNKFQDENLKKQINFIESEQIADHSLIIILITKINHF